MENLAAFLCRRDVKDRNLVLRYLRILIAFQVEVNDLSFDSAKGIMIVHKEAEIDAVDHDIKVVLSVHLVITRVLLTMEVEEV